LETNLAVLALLLQNNSYRPRSHSTQLEEKL